MLTLGAPLDSLIINQTHRFAYCWEIERTDTVYFRYTTHSTELILSDGYTYSPAGGFSATATRKESGLKEHNQEFNGIITTDEITHNDLRGGKFREAKVTQYLVDFKYPWVGSFQTIVYWIAETRFDGEKWNAEVVGLGRRLKQKIGYLLGRTCKYEVGDTDCQATVTPVTGATVGTVLEERREFTTGGIGAGYPDNYFNHGKVIWTSGANDGLISEVKDWTQSTVTVELILPTPFDIENGDEFTIKGGCEKTLTLCNSKWSNLVNFGGDPYVPGTDKMFQSPSI